MIIAHLSDLHINTEIVDSNLHRTEFLLLEAMRQGAAHIIITGDVSDNARDEDFEALRKLFAKYGLLHSSKLSMVVGNHDIFGGVTRAEDIVTFPERCRTTDYYHKLHQFHDYFREAFQGCVYKSLDAAGYPFAKILGNTLFIGLNSIQEYGTIKNPFASNGSVSEKQMDEVKEILMYFDDRVTHKVVMMHHHFNKMVTVDAGITGTLWQNIEKQTMKLRKKKKLAAFFKSCGIDLVMHGHVHLSDEYNRHGVRFLNAGASVRGYGKGFVTLNLINVGSREIAADIQLLEYTKKRKPQGGGKLLKLQIPDTGLADVKTEIMREAEIGAVVSSS